MIGDLNIGSPSSTTAHHQELEPLSTHRCARRGRLITQALDRGRGPRSNSVYGSTLTEKTGAGMDTRCPCCEDLLQDPRANPGSVELSDARPGDRWCGNCRWVLLQEVLVDATQWPALECPTHGVIASG